MNNLKDAADAVANWWADAMQKPMNQDNGVGDDPMGGMMFMLMNTIAMNAQGTINSQKIETFKTALASIIVSDKIHMVGVDYDPCNTLSAACHKAGIDSRSLPCKSDTYIDMNTFVVKAKMGYAKSFNQIYPKS